jgi:hypothetical protein
VSPILTMIVVSRGKDVLRKRRYPAADL